MRALVLATVASLLFASGAVAAPVLEVDVARFPAQVNRGDESMRYEVVVSNASPADPTSGALDLSLSPSPGLTVAAASGPGWTCSPAPLSCGNSAVVPAGGSYPPLQLSEVWVAPDAPATVSLQVGASGAGAAAGAETEDSVVLGPAAPFGLASAGLIVPDETGVAESRAGAHPYEISGAFELRRRRGIRAGTLVPVEDLRSGVTELPAGLVANLESAGAACDFAALEKEACPAAAAVGGVTVFTDSGEGSSLAAPRFAAPEDDVVYRLRSEGGVPASFGFKTLNPALAFRVRLRSDGDFGLSQSFPQVSQAYGVHGISIAFCGFGAELAPGGDFTRCARREELAPGARPFLSLGTACASGPPLARFAVDSWTHRGSYRPSGLPDLGDPSWSVADISLPQPTGCGRLVEEWTGIREPSFELRADSHATDSPAAYVVRLHVPQDGLEDPDGLATSHLAGARVSLPSGLSLNPGFADGLRACSEEQIGLLGSDFLPPNRIRFDASLPACPLASKIGAVSLRTPLFGDPLEGSVYLAAQHANPFGSDYAIYVAVEARARGVVAKLPGRIDLDPRTGQVEISFRELPQLPFEDLELRLFGGGRAALATPVTCGERAASTELVPWSAADPAHPRPDEVATPAGRVAIASGPGGSTCPASAAARPFDVGMEAGTVGVAAGVAAPFSLRITRPDGSQELARAQVSPPPGLVASLRAVSRCAEAQIPDCPPGSRVGTTVVGAGAGPSPLYLGGGVYLAGPYRGAPLSLVAVVPGRVGPFDLGDVVIRSALQVDPRTARLTVVTDPLPRLVGGIPLRIRDLRIDLDRPGFARTPTSCAPAAVDAFAFGSGGAVARLSNRFQVGGCEELGFRPRLSLALAGAPPRRGGHPRLRVSLGSRKGDASVRRATVVLPATELLDSTHIRGVCPPRRFAAHACPARSAYGFARAWSPLLDEPLEGPVYLRAGEGRLPDLAVSLDGQIPIDVVGHVDSVEGRLRISLPALPDVPLAKLELTMRGGRYGLLVNSTRLCRAKPRASAFLRGHNGKWAQARVPLRVNCG